MVSAAESAGMVRGQFEDGHEEGLWEDEEWRGFKRGSQPEDKTFSR
jgi:hypothetical protein